MNNVNKIKEKDKFEFQINLEKDLNADKSKFIKNYLENRIKHKYLLEVKYFEINNNKLVLFFENFKGITLRNFVKNKNLKEKEAIKLVKKLFEFFTNYALINFYNFEINVDNILINDYFEIKILDSNIYNIDLENKYFEDIISNDYLFDITNVLYYLIYKNKVDNNLDFSSKKISKDLINFFNKALHIRYNRRIKLKNCLSHIIFKNIDENKISLKSLNINNFSNKNNKIIK